MHPVLFQWGTFALYSYGLFMALGVLAGLWVVDREAQRWGWDRDEMMRLVVWTFFAGLVGSRLVYVMTRWQDPQVSVVDLLLNPRAGFVFYGGLMGSWLYLMFFLWRRRARRDVAPLPFWSVLDGFALAICLGLAVGRLGCFTGGCCYGTPTDGWWGVVMVREAYLGALHPVQLYEFGFLIVFFLFLWWRRERRSYAGEAVVQFVGVYAIGRAILEVWRGDLIRGFVGTTGLSTSQFLSLFFLAVAVALHFRLRSQRE